MVRTRRLRAEKGPLSRRLAPKTPSKALPCGKAEWQWTAVKRGEGGRDDSWGGKKASRREGWFAERMAALVGKGWIGESGASSCEGGRMERREKGTLSRQSPSAVGSPRPGVSRSPLPRFMADSLGTPVPREAHLGAFLRFPRS